MGRMKVWKKLYISDRIVVHIPVNLFIASGYNPNSYYMYKIWYDNDEKVFKVKVKPSKLEQLP